MQIRLGPGSALAALSLIGTGFALAYPEAKWFGFVLIGLGVLGFLFDFRLEHGRARFGHGSEKLQTWGPWILIVGGPLIGGFWLFLNYLYPPIVRSELDQKIKVDCSVEGSLQIPESRKFWEFIITSAEPPNIAFQFHSFPATAKLEQIDFPKHGYKCRITNYSDQPVFKIKAVFKVEFWKRIPPNKDGSNIERLGSKDTAVSIEKIGPGDKEAFEFFVQNITDFDVMLVLPKSLEMQRLGSDKLEIVRPIEPSLPAVAIYPQKQMDDTARDHKEAGRPAQDDRKKLVVLPVGTLRYVNFFAEVLRSISTKNTSIKMMVEVENLTDHLIKYHARLDGSVAGKTDGPIEFEGFIQSNDKNKLMYNRILDVPTNENPNPSVPVVEGFLYYDVTYWPQESPDQKRRTAAKIGFAMQRPFSDTPSESGYPITVRRWDQIEE